jgi:peptidoglycan/xylan/chitin deacetylase (PgdA/CDA1 family)
VSQMSFTFSSYRKLISLIYDNGYIISDYHSYKNFDNPCILRHDIDMSLEKALEFALFEVEVLKAFGSAHSTYFVLLSSDFYNAFSKASQAALRQIASMGHEVGLHFDEVKYDISGNTQQLIECVEKEIELLSGILGTQVTTVSMHRPSKFTLDGDIRFPGAQNSYSKEFMNDFKYMSDSRMHWREDVFSVVQSRQHEKLHILTHPIWYGKNEETTREKLLEFFNRAKTERYLRLSENIKDIQEFVRQEDVQL